MRFWIVLLLLLLPACTTSRPPNDEITIRLTSPPPDASVKVVDAGHE